MSKRQEKDARQRLRLCLDEQIVHIRCGWWWGDPEVACQLVGQAQDLHGTECTCCPRREESGDD